MLNRFSLTTTYVLIALILDLYFGFSNIFPMFKNGFDLRKFILWFVIPIVFIFIKKPYARINFSFSSIQKIDWLILAGISLIAISAMFIIPHIEVLNQHYINRGDVSLEHKMAFIKFNLFWITSWAFGWELLIRYFWLNSFDETKSKLAYFLVPLIEILYHYNKPWPEIIGVGALSLSLVFWSLKRKNMLPAMIAHLMIEIILVVYLIL